MRAELLLGAGHAHLQVLRKRLLSRTFPAGKTTLITNEERPIYSGMLPGWMHGKYTLEQCTIDVRALAAAAGVELVVANVCAIDSERRLVSVEDGRLFPFELLSINSGAEVDCSWLEAAGSKLLPIRPLNRFVEKWPVVLMDAQRLRRFRLIVVGGGAASIELAIAAKVALMRLTPLSTVTLVSSERGILPEHSRHARAIAVKALHRHGIPVHAARAAATEEGVLLADGQWLLADCIIAATGARAPSWLRRTTLEKDEFGFLLVDEHHRSLSDPNIFAAGDICSRPATRLRRSGAHAVASGRILAENLMANSTDAPLRCHHPRRSTLYLINTGAEQAILSWGALAFEGRWAWHLKDAIDRGFLHGLSPAIWTSGIRT